MTPMTPFRTLLAAAALISAAANSTAFAAPLTVTGTGESFAVQYDEHYAGNIVGGGAVASETRGKDNRVVYAQANHAMTAGVPVFVGGSEGTVAYLPAQNQTQLLASR
jgi:hypothetical protein